MFEIFKILSEDDLAIAQQYVPSLRAPELIIAPDDVPYIYRWEIVRNDPVGGIYFHIQVKNDPDERGLHDHPWANMSVILSGSYIEEFQFDPPNGLIKTRHCVKGDIVFRPARMAHLLSIPNGTSYVMTQFAFGPVVRDWGFWKNNIWTNSKDCTETIMGVTRNKRFK